MNQDAPAREGVLAYLQYLELSRGWLNLFGDPA